MAIQLWRTFLYGLVNNGTYTKELNIFTAKNRSSDMMNIRYVNRCHINLQSSYPEEIKKKHICVILPGNVVPWLRKNVQGLEKLSGQLLYLTYDCWTFYRFWCKNPTCALQPNWSGGMTGSLSHTHWRAVATSSEWANFRSQRERNSFTLPAHSRWLHALQITDKM